MTQPPPWKAFGQRTSEIKQKVEDLYDQYADKQLYKSALDLYDKLKWGLLDDGLLYRGLKESEKQRKPLSSEEIKALQPHLQPASEKGVEEEEDEGEEGIVIPPQAPEEIFQSLRWFRTNAPNLKIKNEADDEFYIRLLDLYITHVNKTGETYFSDLEGKLRDLENKLEYEL